MTQSVKQELYRLCQEYVDKRIESSRHAIAEAQESANEETKSSSGDKYETGRAMAQLEIEKNSQQLAEALKLKSALDQIRIGKAHPSVQPGSLVITDGGVFFIAISLGVVKLHDDPYMVIAPTSPLGVELMGSRVGDTKVFKGRSYLVHELI
jgi:transcription elongation GreA/GreB family factor